ncbi:MAG: apolipoprotein N-acyltransferase [Thermodesulfobacteriota bacterium]
MLFRYLVLLSGDLVLSLIDVLQDAHCLRSDQTGSSGDDNPAGVGHVRPIGDGRARLRHEAGSLVAAAGSGLLLASAFPRSGLDALAWVCLVPLLWALERCSGPPRAALVAWVSGVVFFSVDLRWIYLTLVTHGHFSALVALVIFLVLVSFLALYFAGFGFGFAAFASRGWSPALAGPFLWVALEFLRTHLLSGFPWDLVGYSQAGHLSLLQVVDITGVYGVSWLVVLANVAVWEVVESLARRTRPSLTTPLFALAMLAAVLSYGHMRLSAPPEVKQPSPMPKIAVIQGNIPQIDKWKLEAREATFRKYEQLAERTVGQGAELLVWPETSVPVLFGSPDPDQMRPRELSLKLGVPMLIGAPSVVPADEQPRYYNSAFLIDGLSLQAEYHKMHLVPFGEYTPLTWLIGWRRGLVVTRHANYSSGDHMTVMQSGTLPRFSVLICYEAIFPGLAREALHNGAQMLINITNDGWFGDSAAPYQHVRMARVRAVENRVSLIRCANTGISAVIDPRGRITHSIPLNTEGSFVADVPSEGPVGSFYSRYGDLFAWTCVMVCIAFGVLPRKSRLSHVLCK